MRSRSLSLLLTGLLLSAVAVHPGDARERAPAVSLSWAPGDTVRVVARWAAAPATDVAYATRWAVTPTRAPFPLTKGQRTALADTVFLAAPATMTDSVRVDFAVWSVRIATGRASRDTSKASRWFKRPDVAPPGPGPAGLDTTHVATADSVLVLLTRADITAGDTTIACALVRKAGTWYVGEPAGLIRSQLTAPRTAQLDLSHVAAAAPCRTLAPFAVVAAIAPTVTWGTDTVVVLNPGGGNGLDGWTYGPLLERRSFFRARVGNRSAPLPHLRAH